MAHARKEEKEKKTVPVNILLTEETNIRLSEFALRISTPEERISKSDIVRATLEAGLPLFDSVRQNAPELSVDEVSGLLTQRPVLETLERLAQETSSTIPTRGAVRVRGAVRTRGGGRGQEGAVGRAVRSSDEIELVSPVNTAVSQAPTFAWKVRATVIKAHLSARTTTPLRCSVSVVEDGQEVWGEAVAIALPKGARPDREAQIERTVPMPAEAFERLSALSAQRWRVRVFYTTPGGPQEAEASSLFLKVAPHQAAMAEVGGLLGRGRSYEEQGLLEESATFFRQALEMSCRQLIDIYRTRGLPKAEEYQRLLDEIGDL